MEWSSHSKTGGLTIGHGEYLVFSFPHNLPAGSALHFGKQDYALSQSDTAVCASPEAITSIAKLTKKYLCVKSVHGNTLYSFKSCHTAELSHAPTAIPTAILATPPTAIPTTTPTAIPTATPTAILTTTPTASPTATPTAIPTHQPTATPTHQPTASPTATPTTSPTATPTASPTATPTAITTTTPTAIPTHRPTAIPTHQPTATPTQNPISAPTAIPSAIPTATPTLNVETVLANANALAITLYQNSTSFCSSLPPAYPDFCWADLHVTRGAGTIPTSCSNTQFPDFYGGLCYQVPMSLLALTAGAICPSGYVYDSTGIVCYADGFDGLVLAEAVCATSGWTNVAGICYAPGYSGLTAAANCGNGYFESAGLCYPNGVTPAGVVSATCRDSGYFLYGGLCYAPGVDTTNLITGDTCCGSSQKSGSFCYYSLSNGVSTGVGCCGTFFGVCTCTNCPDHYTQVFPVCYATIDNCAGCPNGMYRNDILYYSLFCLSCKKTLTVLYNNIYLLCMQAIRVQ